MTNPQENVDKFFQDLPDEDKEVASMSDILGEKSTPQEAPSEPNKEADDTEEVEDSVKNRRHRRLEQRWQSEREANIALTARVQVLSEMDKFSKEHIDEVDPVIAKMFLSDDVGKENALRLSQVIKNAKSEAKEEAIREFEERQHKTQEEQKKYETEIDNQLEYLEDTYNVDLTSDAPKARKARREFLELVQKLSPKDEQGDLIGYADFESTFDIYRQSNQKESSNTQKKEIASRSMQRSVSGSEVPKQRTPGFDGWKTDYGIKS